MQAILNNRAPGAIADMDNQLALVAHSAGSHVIT